MANKFLDREPKEYLRVGFWLWLNSFISSLVLMVVWAIVAVILIAIGIAMPMKITDVAGLMQAGIIAIILAIAGIMFALFVSGVVFDKLTRKKI